MKHESYLKQLSDIRETLISDVKNEILKNNAVEIDLDNPIMFNFIDDQSSEVIARVTSTGNVITDTGYDMKTIPFIDVPTEILILILEAIETGSFVVWEERE
jgi:hypothetical protein